MRRQGTEPLVVVMQAVPVMAAEQRGGVILGEGNANRVIVLPPI